MINSIKKSPLLLPKHLPRCFSVLNKRKLIPNKITKPNYYLTGLVEKVRDEIPVKKIDRLKREELMAEACGFAAIMRIAAMDAIRVGMTTEQLDEVIHRFSVENGFYPAALDYKNFPKSVSTSVNDVACHGIPDNRKLRDGDILKVDCMAYVNGYFGDCCGTFIVGKRDAEKEKLLKTARSALLEAIKICKPGQPFSAIGHKISEVVESQNLTVLPDLAGHGIGRNLHDKPCVLHFRNDYDHGVMREGMTFTIEPIVTSGNGETYVADDGWSIKTKDGHPCAQFEETVLITRDGTDVLTNLMENDSVQDFLEIEIPSKHFKAEQNI